MSEGTSFWGKPIDVMALLTSATKLILLILEIPVVEVRPKMV